MLNKAVSSQWNEIVRYIFRKIVDIKLGAVVMA